VLAFAGFLLRAPVAGDVAAAVGAPHEHEVEFDADD